MAILKSVPDKFRTEWEAFNSDGGFASRFLLNVGVMPLSQSMVDCILGFMKWDGVRRAGADGGASIGYGRGNPDLAQGMTEDEAYAEWLAHAKGRQRAIVSQLPVVEMPQTAFDALVSLYADTGKWRTIEAEEGDYDARHAVERADWRTLADMLARGRVNPSLRNAEARAVQLGRYARDRTRAEMRTAGLQDIRRRHVESLFADGLERGQAEYVYFRETGSFLPGLPETRRRRIMQTAL